MISGLIPLDISAKEFAKIYEDISRNTEAQRKLIKESARRQSMANWQTRWENCAVGRWTHRLIPQIDTWLNRNHGETDYNLTQFLTGHGGYRSYLYRFGHDDSPRCPNCPEQNEDVEHVMFVCNRFAERRRILETDIGHRLSPENIICTMMSSEENWNIIASFVTHVNESLRMEEQKRKKQRTAHTLIQEQ